MSDQEKLLCLDCGQPRDAEHFHYEAPGNWWGAAIHHFRSAEPRVPITSTLAGANEAMPDGPPAGIHEPNCGMDVDHKGPCVPAKHSDTSPEPDPPTSDPIEEMARKTASIILDLVECPTCGSHDLIQCESEAYICQACNTGNFTLPMCRGSVKAIIARHYRDLAAARGLSTSPVQAMSAREWRIQRGSLDRGDLQEWTDKGAGAYAIYFCAEREKQIQELVLAARVVGEMRRSSAAL